MLLVTWCVKTFVLLFRCWSENLTWDKLSVVPTAGKSNQFDQLHNMMSFPLTQFVA